MAEINKPGVGTGHSVLPPCMLRNSTVIAVVGECVFKACGGCTLVCQILMGEWVWLLLHLLDPASRGSSRGNISGTDGPSRVNISGTDGPSKPMLLSELSYVQ